MPKFRLCQVMSKGNRLLVRPDSRWDPEDPNLGSSFCPLPPLDLYMTPAFDARSHRNGQCLCNTFRHYARIARESLREGAADWDGCSSNRLGILGIQTWDHGLLE